MGRTMSWWLKAESMGLLLLYGEWACRGLNSMGLSGVGCSSHTVFRAVVAIRGSESADCTKTGPKYLAWAEPLAGWIAA